MIHGFKDDSIFVFELRLEKLSKANHKSILPFNYNMKIYHLNNCEPDLVTQTLNKFILILNTCPDLLNLNHPCLNLTFSSIRAYLFLCCAKLILFLFCSSVSSCFSASGIDKLLLFLS